MRVEQRNSLWLLQWMMAASLMLPVILFAYATHVTIQSTTETASAQIDRMLDIVAEHALKVFETIDLSLSQINETIGGLPDAEITDHEAAFHTQLETLTSSLPQLKSAWIMDREGHPLVNSLVAPAPKAFFGDRDYFRAHVDKDIGTFIGQVLVPRQPYQGEPFFSLSRRRKSASGNFGGVIQTSVLPRYFEQFYARVGRDPGSFLALGLANGMTLARYPARDKSVIVDRQSTLGRQIVAQPTRGGTTAVSPIDGVERQVVWRRLDPYPVYVAAGLETAAIRARWMSTLERQLLFGIPATALVFFILLFALRRTRTLCAEAARREAAEAALQRSRKLEALGQLTGGVAHDFNNLLTIIGSSADLLRRPALSPERRDRYAKAIVETVARASRLTQQLLAFARRQTLNPEIFDVCDRLRQVDDLVRTLAGSRIDVVADLPETPLYINVDLGQFETALINLVANARDAMDMQGTLTLRACALDRLPSSVGRDDGRPWVRIDIVDTGKGIGADEIDRIFEPFFTTKDVGKGTGLGLSQVFGFAKQSGGDVTVASQPGRGTTFSLYLARAVAPAATQPQADRDPQQFDLSGVRILLVEDNHDVGTFAVTALEDAGGKVTFVERAVDALARLSEGAEDYDVVFTDVMMPGMSGIELGLEIRRRYAHLPVVLTSGFSQVLADEGRQGFELLHKPYSADAMIGVLRDAIRRAPNAWDRERRQA